MKKSLKITLLTVTAILIGTAVWFFFLRKDEQNSLSMQTEAVTYGDITNSVTATGTLEPLVTVEVGTQVSGEIDKIYVDYGSMVKKGQILAELDRSNLKATLVSTKASFESANNELTYQRSNYERIKQLYEKQSVSKTDYETATYQYNSARFEYVKAKSELEKAQTNLGYATIYSPIDGVVLSRAVDEGQTVAASFSTPTMFTIAKDLTKMRVIADVDEADIGNVKVGQNVTFTVDAFPNDEFSGTVTTIRLEAQVASNVVTYEVVIDAPNPKQKLLPGLTASVSIMTEEKRNVLVMPSKAQRVQPTEEILTMVNGADAAKSLQNVQTSDKAADASTTAQKAKAAPKVQPDGPDAPDGEPNQRTIWVKNADGTIAQRTVVIGATNGTSTEVISGLKKGELVIIEMSVSANATETAAAETTATSSSPFMPKRPGQKTK
jgi:HlyD family secretion protein